MHPVTIHLSTGTSFTFAPLTAWNIIVYQRDNAKADLSEMEGALFLVFCSAENGGFKGSFEDFAKAIPHREFASVVEAARPFLLTDVPSG